MKSVRVIGWETGFSPISFLKLLRGSGVRSLSLAEAKDRVDQVLAGEPISVHFQTNEQAVAFVRQALELGAVTSNPIEVLDELSDDVISRLEPVEPQLPSETNRWPEIDFTTVNKGDIDSLADAWLACSRLPMTAPERVDLQWIMNLEFDFLEDAPEYLWLLILAIHGKDQSPRLQEFLAAGPLESLLGRHGADFIDRVETQARIDPGFAKLLGGVWKSTITDEIWLRVQAVWDRRGWDGIPN